MNSERPCSWVEVDLGHIKKNYTALCRMTGGEVIAVIKANAYGHGDAVVARALREAGATRFAVASLDEAKRVREALRDSLIECEIIVLGYTPTACAEELFRLGITQTLISREYAEALSKEGYRVRCHLAVDTGMRRIGVMPDIKNCRDILSGYKDRLDITGIFTHLASADGTSEEDRAFTKRQTECFLSLLDGLGDYNLSAHCLNSAGVLYHKDEVDRRLLSPSRVGIALYGLSPRCDGLVPAPLSPTLGWRTVIAALRDVNRGESIGYGRGYVAERDMLVGTLPVGYADGYPRELSSRGLTLVSGHRAPVVGRVCMNQMMIDVSGVPDVKLGDEVTLIGKDEDEWISADTLALLSGKISYDILTGIREHIPRIYK